MIFSHLCTRKFLHQPCKTLVKACYPRFTIQRWSSNVQQSFPDDDEHFRLAKIISLKSRVLALMGGIWMNNCNHTVTSKHTPKSSWFRWIPDPTISHKLKCLLKRLKHLNRVIFVNFRWVSAELVNDWYPVTIMLADSCVDLQSLKWAVNWARNEAWIMQILTSMNTVQGPLISAIVNWRC